MRSSQTLAEAAPSFGGRTDLLARLTRLIPGVVYQYRLWPDGRSAFPYASPGMEMIYEVTPDEVREDATPVFARLHPDDAANVGEDILASARTLETFAADFRVVLPRQGLRWRWSEAVPERLEDGSTLWHGIILDNTERKLAELEAADLQAQLLQAQKLESIGRLAGGIAHDFNNMLGVILGNVDLALDDPASDGCARRELLEIQAAARRSAEMTRQLLSFARRQPDATESLDLNASIPATLVMLRRLIREDVGLTWDSVPGLWPVDIDPTQFDQVLTNLCVNARDAIDGLGTIAIRTANRHLDAGACEGLHGATPGDYVELTVTDTGSGMAPDTLARVFEPFFTTKPRGEGTGLGLSVVHGCVGRCGGFVAVSSEPGRGTTVTVRLPRGSAPRRPLPGPAAPPAAAPARGTILVVEDEPALVRLVERVLRDEGYDVLTAGTPGEAIRLARQHARQVTLLLSDVVMPEMSGPELAEHLGRTTPGLRVLLMSGYVPDELASGTSPTGAPVIRKPFLVADLLDAVNNAIGS